VTHRFLVPADRVQGDSVSFSTEQWHQLHAVLRVRIGDRVRVFDGHDRIDRVVEIVSPGAGRVVDQQPQATEPRTRLIAHPALLQRDKFEPVLQKLTEIGVAAIGPVLTARGIVREAPDAHRQMRWQAILREAAEQCGRGVVPELLPACAFSRAIERAAMAGTVVMAFEGERQHTLREGLAGARSTVSRSTVSLFVGPEGGFAPDEVALARQAGVRLTTLGPRILRSETASPTLAALVLYELGDLSSHIMASDDQRP
jgi:16S rRNA (uracil1498-N3)-methyltransferase